MRARDRLARVVATLTKWFSRDNGEPSPDTSAYYSSISNAVCKQCLDTGEIIRGHDGAKITCPNCRLLRLSSREIPYE